jgi:sec-independent protein translocase protein TatA
VSIGPLQIAIVVLLVVFLFGGKRLGRLGLDLGKGVRTFKKALSTDSSEEDSKPGEVNWVKSAAKVAKTALEVRKVTKVGRFLR